jgi:Na+-translocating ferredoxin:NAD+ oxidoreductase RnfC subunit
MECGSCAYVCPSHRRLVHNFKFGKYMSNQLRRKAAEKDEKKKES